MTTVTRLRTDDAPGMPAANVPPEAVIVFPFMNIGRSYDILGVVVAASSTGDATGDRTHAAYGLLQKEAAALGANAIIYAGEPPRPPAMVLGLVALDVVGDGDDAAAAARRIFGETGADAIIHVQLTKLTGYVLRTGLFGLAVRMTP